MSTSPNQKISLAIVTTANNAVSDTFIQAHITMLNANVSAYYGLPMPILCANKPVATQSIAKWKRLLPAFIYDRIKLSVEDAHKKIEANFKHHGIQVVLAEYGHTACKLLPVCKKLNLPLIVHFHGHDACRDSILNTYGKKYIEVFAYSDAIISVSKAMTKQLIKIGAPENKIVYNPYGPRQEFFDLKVDYSNGYFLSVGRFVEKKAPYLTLLAFQQLQLKYPKAKLVMVGDGPLLPICQKLVESNGILNVVFTGALPHQQTIEHFSKAYCLVQHSIIASDGDSEGTPVAILEAGAAGLPVVATRHAGIPDVIVEGETGLLVNEGDTKGMSEQLIKIYESEELRLRLGNAARNRIKEHFTIKKHLDKLDSIISKSAQRQ